MRALTLLALALAFVVPQSGFGAELEAGNWKLTYPASASEDSVEMIVKLEQTDGKWNASLVGANKKSGVTDVKSVAIDGGQIHLLVDRTGTDYLFEGPLTGTKSIRGSYGAGDRLRPAQLIWTDETKLDSSNSIVRHEAPEAFKQFYELRNAVNELRRKLVKAKDDEAKELREELTAKQKELTAEQPKLLRRALADTKEPALIIEAALSLLRNIHADHPTSEEVGHWANDVLAASEAFGPRYRNEMLLQVGELLVQYPRFASIALEMSSKAAAVFSGDANPARRARYLNVTVVALRRLDRPDDAKKLQPELDAAEAALDVAFLTKLPKIAAKPYAGRKNPEGRTVLMELFTGAECPPCVAADYAFELLQDVYRPTELIQLQYHLHIPSPDPLTNADNEARWKYYSRAFPKKVQGTPTAVFCGEPSDEDDGGSLRMTGRILKIYRNSIDAGLEEPAQARIALDVTRKGDRLAIRAKVSDVASPKDEVRLRFAIVETNVRYQGSNGFRHHRNVVRAMPGGVAGFPISVEGEDREVTADLAELRTGLSNYLDEFARERLPFPKPQRPMEFKQLKVVAFVQDDASHVVRQAVQADVPEAN